MHNSALVLFSGGQDSATILAWALERYSLVETIGFDYGQRHAVELHCRERFITLLRQRYPAWSVRLGMDHRLDLQALHQISDCALTRDQALAYESSGLPNTFVPGRNLVFLTFSAALAFRRGLSVLVGGMCETDYSGYPDCRDDTIKAMQVALSLGIGSRFVLETPLMWLDKAATWQMAADLGGTDLVDLIRDETHTCYLGERTERHEWGFGCGQCPACKLRSTGYARYQLGTVTA
jgi:7-cyano-7-deazaguanine synthase